MGVRDLVFLGLEYVASCFAGYAAYASLSRKLVLHALAILHSDFWFIK